jgi:hypothetical protein
MSARCKSCQAEVVRAMTQRGKPIPLEAVMDLPSPDIL